MESAETSERKPNPDELRPQTVLSAFQDYLRQAAGSLDELSRWFLDALQFSRLEKSLPEIPLAQENAADAELERCLPRDSSGRTISPEALSAS